MQRPKLSRGFKIALAVILSPIIILLLVVVFLLAGTPLMAEFNAYRAFLRKDFTMREYGLPSDCGPEYHHLLKEKYNVEIQNMGCIVFEDPIYLDKYNAALMRRINGLYGKDVFKEVADAACGKSQDKYPDEPI